MKNKLKNFLIALVLFTTSGLASAEKDVKAIDAVKNSNVLIYIQPFEYINEVKLQHFSQELWIVQGPMVEDIAKEKFKQSYGEVSMCEGNQSGKILIWLQPKMFYNGQLQVFYGEVKANVYTGIGNYIDTYIGESTQHGSLGIQPNYWLEKSYTQAIDQIQVKMHADKRLQALIDDSDSALTADTPCSMVTLLPVPRIRAMSF